MRKKRYYIKRAGGRKISTGWWIAVWLLMDRLSAPEWLYGIYWFCVFIFITIFLYDCYKYEEIGVDAQDILKDWKDSQDTYEKLNKEKGFKPIVGGM